jgi:Cd2+/Zn2+-exporting ATPase
LIAATNGVLLLAGLVAEIAGQTQTARWLFLASALIGGAPIFLLAAGNILRSFDLTAGVMVSIAMIAAIIVGEYSAAALVALMMLVGEVLEDFTVARADGALNALEQLVPSTVTVRRDGIDEERPLDTVRRGDVVLVRPGGRVPVDGIIQAGESAVDQSAITGESIPVDKSAGDDVFAGTLNTTGALEVKVEEVGEQTTLGHMIDLVKRARETEAPVQRLANQYAQYLAPMAIVIAIITGLVTGDITRAITVLIVICPCSLVLATPTAVTAAIGNAARHGVLVKDGPTMEQIGKASIVAFDKTGTLTLGKPRLQETLSLNGMASPDILKLAASAERSSEHPLARAVVEAARRDSIQLATPEVFRAMPGHGITATVDGQRVAIGQRVLKQHGVPVTDEVLAQIEQLQAEGKTVIPVAIDDVLAGLLTFTDTVRPESQQAVADLAALGLSNTVLISGDSQTIADAIGKDLGVSRVYAEMLPEQKLNLIEKWQAEGHSVIFVGDGVNDAPALAKANVGIAMGGIGTHVAMETADIVLLNDQLGHVPNLIALSRQTLATIRNNVIFAMSMNVLSVVLSTTGVIGPVFGAVMHEVSALPVVANSARLITSSILAE